MVSTLHRQWDVRCTPCICRQILYSLNIWGNFCFGLTHGIAFKSNNFHFSLVQLSSMFCSLISYFAKLYKPANKFLLLHKKGTIKNLWQSCYCNLLLLSADSILLCNKSSCLLPTMILVAFHWLFSTVSKNSFHVL